MSTKKLQSGIKNHEMGQIKDRLLEAIETLEGGNSAKFYKKSGIAQSTFHNYLQGRMPSSENLIRIRDAYGIDINWLLTGAGTMTDRQKFYVGETKEGYAATPDFDLINRIAAVVEDWLKQGIAAAPSKTRLMEDIYRLATGASNNASRMESGTSITQSGNRNVQQVGDNNKIS